MRGAGEPGLPRPWLLALAALLVARVIASALPGMWLWGLNPPRFVHPLLATVGVGLMAAALLPEVSRRLVPAAEWLGDLAYRACWVARAVWTAVAAVVVWALPDRAHFTGDFMLREAAVANRTDPAVVFPQAFLLDVWLHHTLPVGLVGAKLMTPNGAARVIGMAEAALLGVLAVELSRTLRLRGVASCLTSAAVLFGGYLATMTGSGKAFSELTVLGVAIGVYGPKAALGGSGLGLAGCALACALLLHRSAILLIPVFVGALLLSCRLRRAPPVMEMMLGICAPLAALAWVGPLLLQTIIRFDRPAGYFGASGGTAEIPLNILDALNLLLLLSPMVVLAVGWRGRAAMPGALWWAFALPSAILALSVRHSSQGLFRDWDMFAAPAASACVLAAARVGRLIASAGRRDSWIGVAALAIAVVPTMSWLASQADVRAGLRRAEAFAVEAPARPADVRGRVWAFLCGRQMELGNYPDAVAAGRIAVTLAPGRNALLSLAYAEMMLGDNAAALSDFRRIVALNRRDLWAWWHVAMLSATMGDLPQAEDAAAELAALPGGAEYARQATALIARQLARCSSASALLGPRQ